MEGGSLTFHPRYALAPGITYYAVFHPPESAPIEATFHGPEPAAAPEARVTAIYPSSPVLPANQLKIYIIFSAPMQGGDFWPSIHLFDQDGKPAYLPFVGQELWNRDYTRLTLIFDPGRIKRGVKPNVDLGPVLKLKESVIRSSSTASSRDVNGRPMVEPFRHEFLVGVDERRALDTGLWKLSQPKAGTRDPLVIRFDRPLDYALLSVSFKSPASLDRQLLEQARSNGAFNQCNLGRPANIRWSSIWRLKIWLETALARPFRRRHCRARTQRSASNKQSTSFDLSDTVRAPRWT